MDGTSLIRIYPGTTNDVGGLAATMYGPNSVNAIVGGGTYGPLETVAVAIVTDTDYPFANNITMTINVIGETKKNPEVYTKEVQFPLLLRVPDWVRHPDSKIKKSPEVRSPGEAGMVITIAKAGGVPKQVNWQRDKVLSAFARLDRMFHHGDVVTVHFTPPLSATIGITVSNGWNNRHTKQTIARQKIVSPSHLLTGGHVGVVPDLPFCAVSYGSVTFALPLESSPTAEFNYAIDCNASTMKIIHTSAAMSPWDWALDAPLNVQVRAIPFAWNTTWVLPDKPIPTSASTGPPQLLTLIPYGAAKVYHVSMFPIWNPMQAKV